MDAQERVLTTINYEEPDRVPAFESVFEQLFSRKKVFSLSLLFHSIFQN